MKKRSKKSTICIIIILIIIALLINYLISYLKSDVKASNLKKLTNDEFVIVIDAGHGGETSPGCSYENVYEKEIVLDIAKKLESKLKKQKIKVVMTRNSDTDVSLIERCNIANQNHANLFISIHVNSLDKDTVTNGIETWYNPVKDDKSSVFANCIQQEVIASTNAKNLGTKSSEELVVIRETNMPSCLLEIGFITNKQERNNMIKSSYQDKIVDGIIKGIENYLNNT